MYKGCKEATSLQEKHRGQTDILHSAKDAGPGVLRTWVKSFSTVNPLFHCWEKLAYRRKGEHYHQVLCCANIKTSWDHLHVEFSFQAKELALDDLTQFGRQCLDHVFLFFYPLLNMGGMYSSNCAHMQCVVVIVSREDKQSDLEDVSVTVYHSAAWEHFGFSVSYDDSDKKVVGKTATVISSAANFVTLSRRRIYIQTWPKVKIRKVNKE